MDPIDKFIDYNWNGQYNGSSKSIKLEILEILGKNQTNIFNPDKTDVCRLSQIALSKLKTIWDTSTLIYMVKRSLGMYDEKKEDCESSHPKKLSKRLMNVIKDTLLELEKKDIKTIDTQELKILLALNLSTENQDLQEEALDILTDFIDIKLMYNWTSSHEVCKKILDTYYHEIIPDGIWDKDKRNIYNEACKW